MESNEGSDSTSLLRLKMTETTDPQTGETYGDKHIYESATKRIRTVCKELKLTPEETEKAIQYTKTQIGWLLEAGSAENVSHLSPTVDQLNTNSQEHPWGVAVAREIEETTLGALAYAYREVGDETKAKEYFAAVGELRTVDVMSDLYER